MEFDVEDFKDFKPNDIACDECGTYIGTTSGSSMEGFLCKDCTYEIEELYKELHPELYE